MGGSDFFSNGIHLNVIEAADDPAAESWRNLRRSTTSCARSSRPTRTLVLSALAGDAAAGGVPFALAADHVVAREDVVLNPYYRHMGGLYGSEYWTYLLPRRVGAETTARLTGRAVHARRARARPSRSGCSTPPSARPWTASTPRPARWPSSWHGARTSIAGSTGKRRVRARDEQLKPLDAYRRRRAGPLARVLLRRRPQLPRGASPLRLQGHESAREHRLGPTIAFA